MKEWVWTWKAGNPSTSLCKLWPLARKFIHSFSKYKMTTHSQLTTGVMTIKKSGMGPSLERFLFNHLHWKRPWCWERLKTGGEGDNRGWDGWRASPTGWTWVWASSRSWWWTGRPGVLQSVGSQSVGHDWATELNWTELPAPKLSFHLC